MNRLRKSSMKELEDIEVKFGLTILKPQHTGWVCDFYGYLASTKGEVIIKNGWKLAGIIEVLEKGLSELAPLDPLQSIDPLVDQADWFLTQDTTLIFSSLNSDQLQRYIRMICESEDEGEWEHPESEQNIFELFEDNDE